MGRRLAPDSHREDAGCWFLLTLGKFWKQTSSSYIPLKLQIKQRWIIPNSGDEFKNLAQMILKIYVFWVIYKSLGITNFVLFYNNELKIKNNAVNNINFYFCQSNFSII